MRDMLVVIAGIMSHDDIVNQIEDRIKNYKSNPSQDTFESLTAACALALCKVPVDHAGGGARGIMKTIGELTEVSDRLIKPSSNEQ